MWARLISPSGVTFAANLDRAEVVRVTNWGDEEPYQAKVEIRFAGGYTVSDLSIPGRDFPTPNSARASAEAFIQTLLDLHRMKR